MAHKVTRIHKAGVTVCYMFFCPGCDHYHSFDVARWTFNGDVERPTFSPSLLCMYDSDELRCHLFVTDGSIQYCSDSKHHLSGQTVAMEDIDLPEDMERVGG